MWVFGYTLDNLSLMRLTISVGFVVDDAIVVLENITRYIEEARNLTPRASGSRRNRASRSFRSASCAVAVLIPLLMMAAHRPPVREFAITFRWRFRLDGGVADADAMMASRFLKRTRGDPRTAASIYGASAARRPRGLSNFHLSWQLGVEAALAP